MSEHQQIKKDGRGNTRPVTIRKPDQDEQFRKQSRLPAVQPGTVDLRAMTPSQVLYLQRTIGNAAVRRLLAGSAPHSAEQAVNDSPVVHRQATHEPRREGGHKFIARKVTPVTQQGGNAILVQRRLWANVPAKFQTENDLGAANSEYQVTGSGYRRFAPVNILRGIYDQVYYNSNNRSFVYLTGMPEDLSTPQWNALYEKPRVQSVAGGAVTFTSKADPDSPPVVADMGPSEGAMVYDSDVDDNGKVTHPHVGHPVKALGQALPTLDDPDALLAAQKKLQSGNLENLTDEEAEENVAEAQKQKAIKSSPYI